MSSTIYKNNTYRINISFTQTNQTTNETTPEDPTSVTVSVYQDSTSNSPLLTDTPTKESVGHYYYDYTPVNTGKFFVVFDATFADSSTEQVTYEFDVVSAIAMDSITTTSLMEDQELEFMAVLDPMFYDPELILENFPEANTFEIAELVHFASNEVREILRDTDAKYEDLPFVAIEYIEAYVSCALSKKYGDGDITTVSLGDMAVTRSNAIGFTKVATRGNAVTWCQLKAALRNELLEAATRYGSGKGIKSFQRGSDYPNPMPDRTILPPGYTRVDTDDLKDNLELRSLDD